MLNPESVTQGKIVHDVRIAMGMTQNSHDGAKLVKIAHAKYVFIRQLITLSDAEDRVPAEDRSKMRVALRNIDETGNIKHAREIASALVEKYWVKRSHSGIGKKTDLVAEQAARQKQQEVFDNHLFQIRESCMSANHITPPVLSNHARREAIDTLLKCIVSLNMLMLRTNNPQKEKPKEE